MLFACSSLSDGFCQKWVEIESTSFGPEISAAGSSLSSTEMFQALTLGFSVAGSVFLVSWGARTVRRMLSDLHS